MFETTLPVTLPVPTPESPVIGFTNDERHLAVVAWHHTASGLALPVVSLRCHCGVLVSVTELGEDTIWVARVRGDSRYGYEAYHRACC